MKIIGRGREENAYEFPTICFPSRDLILAGHGQMDSVHHHAVPRRLRGSHRGRNTIRRIQKTLIITRLVLLMEPGGETKIREFDVSVLVY